MNLIFSFRFFTWYLPVGVKKQRAPLSRIGREGDSEPLWRTGPETGHSTTESDISPGDRPTDQASEWSGRSVWE